jgi:molecular chaperone DnaK (HSP70)
MARGWESKSIEAQQEDAASRQSSDKPRLTREEADRLREKERLQLSLRNVIEQLNNSQNSQHRAMLERAKSDLERRIENLGAH